MHRVLARRQIAMMSISATVRTGMSMAAIDVRGSPSGSPFSYMCAPYRSIMKSKEIRTRIIVAAIVLASSIIFYLSSCDCLSYLYFNINCNLMLFFFSSGTCMLLFLTCVPVRITIFLFSNSARSGLGEGEANALSCRRYHEFKAMFR